MIQQRLTTGAETENGGDCFTSSQCTASHEGFGVSFTVSKAGEQFSSLERVPEEAGHGGTNRDGNLSPMGGTIHNDDHSESQNWNWRMASIKGCGFDIAHCGSKLANTISNKQEINWNMETYIDNADIQLFVCFVHGYLRNVLSPRLDGVGDVVPRQSNVEASLVDAKIQIDLSYQLSSILTLNFECRTCRVPASDPPSLLLLAPRSRRCRYWTLL